jgi:hypothetical protein
MTATQDPFALAGVFPNAEQTLVLRAALGDGAAAIAAYERWRAGLDLAREFDREVFRLIPLLYDNLRRLGHTDSLTGRLKGAYRLAWAKNHRLAEQTRPILDGLLAAGIPVMALKGAPLGLLYYGNPALRPMSDVDLVVPPAHVDAAAAILAGFGYRPWRPIDADARRFRHAMGFFAPGPKEFDLHWHVLFDFCDDGPDAEFWATARPFRFLDREILAPDATRLLLHTIVHGLRWNAEPPIRWVPDSLAILRRDPAAIDWGALLAFAARQRISHRIGLGLAYLAREFLAPVPDHVLDTLARTPTTWVERLERRTILRPLDYDASLGPLVDALASFPRTPDARTPVAACRTFLHFLRYHWGLPGRRAIPARLLEGVLRRARRTMHGPAPAAA